VIINTSHSTLGQEYCMWRFA